MDFLKTLLIYMVALLSASTTGEVQTTPLPPSTAPTAYVTTAPTRIPTVAPTLAPIVTPSPTPIVYTTLYVGDRGENVRRLQRRLAELGYLNDTIDGIYGQKTKRAVERFQYYNGLNSDGVAGQSTQYMLYESRSVIVAPPDITASPSPTPTPYVQRQVYVPIYYVDRAGVLLARTGITMYASGTIYADSTMVSSSYTLASSSSVYVYLNGNYATPASVTFTYDRLTTPAPTAPAPVYIPVYYMAEDNSILYITTCSLARNVTTTVYAQSSLIDSRYRLISASSVDVYVNSAGTPSPASVIFRYSDSSATATPSPTPSAIAYNVYYITEYEELLFTDTVYLDKGRESTVYANSSLVPSGYQLISASSVRVSVSSSGDASPTTVRFTYRKPQTPTPPPSATPTPPPVAYSVYYVTDQDDLLYTDIVYLDRGRESTVYANSSLVPTDYVLTSASSAQVRVAENGDSTPSTVRFIYRKPATPTPRPATPTPTPSPIAYNVYYVTESGDMLYNDIVYLDKGRESTVYANASFVTPDYVLIGADSVQVTVSEYGDPTPGVARFTYRIPETPTPPPVETPTPPPVETPAPPPVETPPPPSAPSGILSPGGTSISVNGITKQGGWYKNDNGAPYLAVDRLADLMGAGYSSDNGAIIYNINGHRVSVRSAAGIARGLSIDGSDRSSSAFSMNGGMYIEEMLLSELGIQMTIDGNTMILNY